MNKKKEKKNLNKYFTQLDQIVVDDKFKPGLRFQYYDYINHFVNNKKSMLTTSIKDLIEIYKICELLK